MKKEEINETESRIEEERKAAVVNLVGSAVAAAAAFGMVQELVQDRDLLQMVLIHRTIPRKQNLKRKLRAVSLKFSNQEYANSLHKIRVLIKSRMYAIKRINAPLAVSCAISFSSVHKFLSCFACRFVYDDISN